jgi:hypothetical protein
MAFVVNAIPAGNIIAPGAGQYVDFTLTPFQVMLPRVDGLGNITLSGTIQEMEIQMAILTESGILAPLNTTSKTSGYNKATEDEQQDTMTHICFDGNISPPGSEPGAAKVSVIKDGISYLRALDPDVAQCILSPGPKLCSRVSCSYDAGIWWCNDNADHGLQLPCSKLANMAEDLTNLCREAPVSGDYYVQGQEFDHDWGFNVVVAQASC